MAMLPYVCKTLSHFQEKIRNLICQCLFYIQFILQSHCPQKTEIVRILIYILPDQIAAEAAHCQSY